MHSLRKTALVAVFYCPNISSPSKTQTPETTKAAEAAFCFKSGLGVLHQD
jgi:hypothetical protein